MADSDFDPKALTHTTDEHTRILSELQDRVGTNENFGKTLKKAAEDSKAIDEALQGIVIKLLNDNKEAREAVEGVVNDVDNRQTKKQLGGLMKIALWIISLIATSIITLWINNMAQNNQPKSQDTKTTQS